jgi:paraquat-inducible protein A
MWVCHDCDALQREVLLKPGATAQCWRCAAVLRRPVPRTLDRTLALTIAAAVVFVIASAFPLVSLDMQGQTHSTSLWGAVATLWEQDARLLAALVFTTTQALPALELAVLIWLLAPLVRQRRPLGGPWLLRALAALRPWGMVEVFVLGVLVALVKMTSIATVVPGVALWAFGALIVLFASAVATFDPHAAWQRLEALE